MNEFPLLQSHIEHLHTAVKQAGAILMEHYQQELTRNHKPDGSFATQADIASEKFLLKELHTIMPEAAFCAEESGLSSYMHDYTWVIDPLDGTTNFAHGIPYFCVSVALTYKHEPIVGCVYNPVTDELFYAHKGGGAFCNGKVLRASQQECMHKAVISLGLSAQEVMVAQIVGGSCQSLRACGASALDIAHCAAGRFDAAIITQFSWWDVAAGMVLMQEAGGVQLTLEGQSFGFGSKSYVGGNNSLAQCYVELIKDENSI